MTKDEQIKEADQRIQKADVEIARLEKEKDDLSDKITEANFEMEALNACDVDEYREEEQNRLSEDKLFYQAGVLEADRLMQIEESAKSAATAEKKQLEQEKAEPKGKVDEEDIKQVKDAFEDAQEELEADHEPPDVPLPTPPSPDGVPPPGQQGQVVIASDGGLGHIPHDAMAHAGIYLELAVVAGYATQKLYQMGQEKAKDLRQTGQEAAKDFQEKLAPPNVELQDLSKEQAAAQKLTQAEGFSEKPIAAQSQEVNAFFAQQDKLRDAGWADLQQKGGDLLAQIHGHYSKAHEQASTRLGEDIKSARDVEDKQVQEWRSEFVQGLCKDAATKDVNEENQKKMQAYDKRLEDLNKEADPKVRENAQLILEMNAPAKIKGKTEEMQDKHFPDFPSKSIESPSLEGPGGGGPGGGR
jgi:hypothetical protein